MPPIIRVFAVRPTHGLSPWMASSGIIDRSEFGLKDPLILARSSTKISSELNELACTLTSILPLLSSYLPSENAVDIYFTVRQQK